MKPTTTLARVQSSRPWEPHQYQKTAVKFLIERPEAGLFLDPGLGKTSSTLGAFSILKKKKLAKRALILAPLRVAQAVWPEEIKKWKDFEHLRVVVLHGPDKDKLVQQDADIYVINYEGIPWLMGEHVVMRKAWKVIDGVKQQVEIPETKYTLKNFNTIGADVLVADESTRLKNHGNVTCKALHKGLGKFKRRWILTGTPAPNGLLDLFGQAFVMDQGKSLGAFITHYKSRYFMPVGFGGFKWEPQPGAKEKIYEALAPYILRLDADDYLKLPEFIEHDIMIDLPPKVRKFYDELETEFLALHDSGELFTAPSVGAALQKCAQVASGACYKRPIVDDDSGIPMDAREWVVFHDEKIDALRDLVEELQGQPLLVAYNFKHDLFRLRKAFGKTALCFDDYKSEKEVVGLVRRWNAGEIPILFGHPASMGHGLNMQDCAAHVAWFSGTFNREHYDQFNKRVLRQNNPNSHVTAHRFIARNTVEELMRLALKIKGKNQGALLDALKEYRKGK